MKHDHKKTKKLKVALFSIVMLLPCLAVGITCLTHVFNKEVAEDTQTATINYQYETNEVNTTNDITTGNIYNFNVNNVSMEDNFSSNTFIKMEVLSGTINTTETFMTSIDEQADMTVENGQINTKTYFVIEDFGISIRIETLNGYIQFSQGSVDEIFTINAIVVIKNVSNMLRADFFTQCATENIPIESVTINTITQDHTTNIFYDSCEQVKDSFVLNWCNTNNPISQPIISFTNVFSLPNDHIINTLLTYWFSISMIYIVIDIIIECIVYITHFFNKEQ